MGVTMIQTNSYKTKWGFSIPAQAEISDMSVKNNGHTHFVLDIMSTESGEVIEQKSIIYEISVDNKTIQQIKQDIYAWLTTATKLMIYPEPIGEVEEKILKGDWQLNN